jgi:hypothetical protein
MEINPSIDSITGQIPTNINPQKGTGFTGYENLVPGCKKRQDTTSVVPIV